MDLHNIPQDRDVKMSEILAQTNISELLNAVDKWSPTFSGLLVIGMNDKGETITWATGLDRGHLLYILEDTKFKMFKDS